MKQQAIDILDEMIGKAEKIRENPFNASYSIYIEIETLKEAKARIQALWDGWTYQDPRPNDRWIEY